MPDNFDVTTPNRLAAIDPSLRNAMGERYFQFLVNREHGSAVMTQFIGKRVAISGDSSKDAFSARFVDIVKIAPTK